MKKTIVVKLGGVASDNLTPDFFKKIKDWQSQNYRVVVVHGGGHYITELMNKLNLSVTIKNGLRVTTKETLAITKMVLIGQVQPMITALFQQNGFSVVGLNASSSHLITGDYLDEKSLGAVGKVTALDTALLDCLLQANHIPIVAPLALTKNGHWLNINADHVACKLAEKLEAEELYLLTDVPGIKTKEKWLKELYPEEIDQLKETNDIKGGMLPKVESALSAVQHGVASVHITNELAKKGTTIRLKEVYV